MLSLLFASTSALFPAGKEKGLIMERFNNEVGFTSSKGKETILSVEMSGFKYDLDGMIITGSYVPQKTGDYKFRLQGKSYARLTIMGRNYPSSLGPGGSCLPASAISTERVSDTFKMFAGRLYPIEIRFRSGCVLYEQYLKLQVSFNGGDWYFPQDFITESVDDCFPNFFGERCDQQCSADCHNNGRCDDGLYGSGLCICNEGFLPPNCSNKIPAVHPGCSKGVKWTTYGDEIGFSKVNEEKVISVIAEQDIKNSFDAVAITGSILPPITGTYQFRLMAKPEGQIQIGGKFYPASLGPAGSCSGYVSDDIVTDNLFMNAEMTYPFAIKYRTGCTTISKHLILLWKNGPRFNNDLDRATWENVPDTALFQCSEEDCIPGKYGSDCSKTCPACNDHSFCFEGKNGTGECLCSTGYFGEKCQNACASDSDCSQNGQCHEGKCYCDDEFYGGHCETKCSAKTTCNGHGTCSKNGECTCETGYYGKSCAQLSSVEEQECEKGATFTQYDGEVLFERINKGPEVIQTVDKIFNGVLYDSATVTGSIVVSVKGNYKFKIVAKPSAQLTIGGQTVPSSLGGAGKCQSTTTDATTPNFITLLPNKYYPFQISYRSGCNIYAQNLQMLWMKEQDNIFTVIPNENLRACSDRQCSPRYSGESCTDFCELSCTHGTCLKGNGTIKDHCVCKENYYGSNCNTFCKSSVTCIGNGVCGASGSCECENGFGGVNCTEKISNSLSGDSMTCPKAASLLWHSNEFFGAVTDRQTITSLEIPVPTSTTFKSITVSGSLSVPATGLYRFRAEGKPTVQLKIGEYPIANPSFTGGLCQNTAAQAESEGISMTQKKMYPFTLQYRSGCSLYTKYLRILYQVADAKGSFEDCTWQAVPTSFIRSCSSNQCESGYYGVNCDSLCPDCGQHGVCLDGISGDGQCKCEDWYKGDKCQYNTFIIAIISFTVIFVAAIVWVCWPTALEEVSDDSSDHSQSSQSSSQRSSMQDLRSSLMTAEDIPRMQMPEQVSHSASHPQMSQSAARMFQSQRSAFNI